MQKHLCPVCGMYEFSHMGSYEVCEVCGWEDDWVQLDDPDYTGGANRLSLNQFRKAWKEGQKANQEKEEYNG